MAHKHIIKDPTGAKRKLVDLHQHTDKFDRYMTDRFICKGYLDSPTTDSCSDTSLTSRPRRHEIPSVRTYVVSNKKNATRQSFRVWVIDNPISPSFKQRLISALNELPFMVGDKGKGRAFVRNSSTCSDSPPPIVIGKSSVYTSVPLSTVEAEILSIANSIAEMQYGYVRKECGTDYKITFHCNLVHTVVGSLSYSMYAPHSDYGQLLCTADNSTDYQHVEDDNATKCR